MATRRRHVVWTEQASRMLDEAVSYVAQDSRAAAEHLLVQALNVASYEATAGEVQILAFIHGARDLTRFRLDG